MNHKSFVIIGGGIIGSGIAREILMRKLGRVIILEKEDHLGEHASGRNSGVIHSGINQSPGSIKAKMCLEGSKRLRQYCREHHVPMNECGTIVVAQNEQEELVLAKLLEMGASVGVENLRMIDQKELNRLEPSVIGKKALVSPSGAVVHSLSLLEKVAAEVKSMNGRYVLSTRAIQIKENRVKTNHGEWEADHIVNAAGLYSDKIAHMMGVGLDYTIIPFRGEYMDVANVHLNTMVYQAPNLKYPFLSVHLTKMIDGRVLAGPTATLSLGRESYKKEIKLNETLEMLAGSTFWRMVSSGEFRNLAFHNARISLFKHEFLKEIQKLCPSVSLKDIASYKSGIRAQMVNRQGKMLDDIVVEFREKSTHILNAVSPGMTSSLAFAEYLVNKIEKN